MVASNPQLCGTDKSRRRIDHAGEAAPIAVQIAGADPAMMADAARYNVERGAQIIDINMGCPAKKVCNAAAGSALLANEPLVAAIVEAVVRAVDVPVTLKIRTGPHPDARNARRDRAHRRGRRHRRRSPCTAARARARSSAPVEYDTIAAVKRAVSHPGHRQRRHRHARSARGGARAHRRRRDHDRPRGAGPAVDLPRDRALPRDRRRICRRRRWPRRAR